MKALCIIAVLSLAACSNQGSQIEPRDEQTVQIYLKWNMRDKLDTFQGTVEKDLVMDGTVKIHILLTKREQEIIVVTAEKLGFFSYPDTVKPQPDVTIQPDPGAQVLRIKAGGRDKSVVWYEPHDTHFKQYSLLMQLRNLIIAIISSKPEYRALPQARGGYQ